YFFSLIFLSHFFSLIFSLIFSLSFSLFHFLSFIFSLIFSFSFLSHFFSFSLSLFAFTFFVYVAKARLLEKKSCPALLFSLLLLPTHFSKKTAMLSGEESFFLHFLFRSRSFRD